MNKKSIFKLTSIKFVTSLTFAIIIGVVSYKIISKCPIYPYCVTNTMDYLYAAAISLSAFAIIWIAHSSLKK